MEQKLDVELSGDPGSEVSIVLPKTELQSADESRRIEIEGRVVAKGCGDDARMGIRFDAPDSFDTPAPRAPDASGLTISVAREALPIRSAIIESTTGLREIAFSSALRSCHASQGESDMGYFLRVGSSGAVENLGLVGHALETSYMTTPPKDLVVKIGGANKDGTRTVEIDGQYDHMGYPVRVKGRIDVLDCTR